MGCVKDAFRALHPLAATELRPGTRFDGYVGEALRTAVGDAARLIATTPATHPTAPDDRPVFPTGYGRMPKTLSALRMEVSLLWKYGVAPKPRGLWHALRRMSARNEPMLVAEWVRLTRQDAEGAGAAQAALRGRSAQQPARAFGNRRPGFHIT